MASNEYKLTVVDGTELTLSVNAGAQGPAGADGDTSIIEITSVSSDNITIKPENAGIKHRLTNNSGCQITIQSNSIAPWTSGQIVYFRRCGGPLTWDNSGITINGDKIQLIEQNLEFALQNVGADIFDFI